MSATVGERLAADLETHAARAPLCLPRAYFRSTVKHEHLARVADHVRACASCRALLRALHATVGQWLESLPSQ